MNSCVLYYLTLKLRVFSAVEIPTFQKLLQKVMGEKNKAFLASIVSVYCIIVSANEALFTVKENHRKQHGVFAKSVGATSLVSCGLACLRNPRCVATNFRKSNYDCELLDFAPSEISSGLKYDDKWIFSQNLKVKLSQ